ncbi:hypothetical protein C1645_780219 [Glomus cerebriforme]|uniref:Uncharacterized protein n=1 Tax=Glomus cerebriforme TaxID=658196 RepID=A0A397SKK6_9GLOM|nr:hypothetical protein C1645_780219 [Glomus cerebriforme]
MMLLDTSAMASTMSINALMMLIISVKLKCINTILSRVYEILINILINTLVNSMGVLMK